MHDIHLKIIGRVRNSVRKMKRDGWESLTSEIILGRGYEEAMEGVEDYSHLFVLFWLSRVRRRFERGVLKIHPRSRPDLPLVGVFATRTQYRPNHPIGLTLVQFLGKKRNVLRVKGLDAMNGTPVLDIKPISPRTEFPRKTKVPAWYPLPSSGRTEKYKVQREQKDVG